MRARACVVVALSLFSSFAIAETCAKGQKQLHPGEPCVPEALFNYLYCLSNSGGGKIEVVKKNLTETKKDLEINVRGKGSGVIVKGEGGAGIQLSDARRVGQELSEKLDPTLAARCENVLNLLVEDAPTRMSKVELNIDRTGGDYKDFEAENIDECLAACVEEDQCNAITFNKSSHQCWMKSSVPFRSDNDAFDSAVKLRPKTAGRAAQ